MRIVLRRRDDLRRLHKSIRAEKQALQRDRLRAVLLALQGQKVQAIAPAADRLWESAPRLMRRILRHCQQIERRFGNLACTPGLLTSRPKFVRDLPRARRFAAAMICIYHAHRLAKTQVKHRV